MTRRNRIRVNRGAGAGGFSLADMRDVVTTATDSLVNEIAAQNPNVDADGFETELRELVTRYGRGGNPSGMMSGGFPAIASAAPSETRYEYSLSGDLLVAAHEYFSQRNWKPFFQTVRDAFRSDDASKLFSAIAEMNSMTDVEDQAAADDENESDILPDDNNELDAGDLLPQDDGDDQFEIHSEEDDDDPFARDEIMADLDDGDPGDHEFRGTESPQPSVPDPMPSGGEPVDDAERRKTIAFLNKVTMSGTPEDRRKASAALDKMRKNGK